MLSCASLRIAAWRWVPMPVVRFAGREQGAPDWAGHRLAGRNGLMPSAASGRLCRLPNYAERFWKQPVAPAHLRPVERTSSGAIRHSLAIYSASRKASRRSFARERVGFAKNSADSATWRKKGRRVERDLITRTIEQSKPRRDQIWVRCLCGAHRIANTGGNLFGSTAPIRARSGRQTCSTRLKRWPCDSHCSSSALTVPCLRLRT